MKLRDLFKKSDHISVTKELVQILKHNPYGRATKIFSDEGSWVILHEHDFQDLLKRAHMSVKVVSDE